MKKVSYLYSLDLDNINRMITEMNQTLSSSDNTESANTSAISSDSMLIYDSGVFLAPKSVQDIIGLTGVKHGGYFIEFFIKNTTGSVALYRLYCNNDLTNANYNVRGNYGGAATGNVNYANDADITNNGLGANTQMVVVGNITVTEDFMFNVSMQVHRLQDGYQLIQSLRNVNALGGNDLTSISISASVVNAIGPGSRFRLWRRI